MENMNLASRCREAISQVATLRKELLVYQKRESEYANLAREVERLKRQVGINTGGPTRNVDHSSNGGGILTMANNVGGDPPATFPSNAFNDEQQEQSRPLTMSSTAVSPDSENSRGNSNGNNRNDSPSTDLDRIMSQQFRKTDIRLQQSMGPTSSSSADTTAPVVTTTTKSDASMNSSSSSSTLPAAPSASKQPRTVARSNNILLTASNSKIPISFNSTKKLTTPSLASASSAIASAAVNPPPIAQQQNDDEFDADIDMVDFFAKSQSLFLNNTIGKNDGNPPSSGPSSSDLLPGSVRTNHVRRSRSSGTDDCMPDDVIPIPLPSSGGGGGGGAMGGISVGAASGGSINYPKTTLSPSSSRGSVGVDNNLLSSLDAFEASFASAFPETSFSITSDIAPLSSASLDMSFDAPDFNPFFKSLVNNNTSSSNNNNINKNNGTGHRQEAASLGAGGEAGGGTWDDSHDIGKNNNCGAAAMKSQMIQDLFPESAMNFKSIPKLDSLAFDSNPMMGFEPMERTRGSMMPTTQQQLHSTVTTMVMPERLDLAFSRVQARGGGKSSSVMAAALVSSRDEVRSTTSQAKLRGSGSAMGNNGPSSPVHHSRLASLLSPQSMSAEIEQLDAIAGNIGLSDVDGRLTTSAAAMAANDAASPAPRTIVRSSVRKVKQPVSYAEPSTKSKLRRGDVLFPKVDSSNKTGGKVDEGEGRITPTSELDRIMDKMAASSSLLSLQPSSEC
ncbi:hypothetical protein ACHAW5_011332 [Stephanodiscus triporus]|uniref:Uncharacterized protein n=1 Tax=Stephanodiscus triporus TaxID=2934178 RepID=A0ABD3QQQ5_9STRA